MNHAAGTVAPLDPELILCVPITSSTSCDQPIFVDHACTAPELDAKAVTCGLAR
jgi:hypothetical protein